MRDLFLLDPDVIFLNHGSFGACPATVFESYQRWQLELERQPVEFLARRSDALLDEARAVLGAYINASPADLIFTPNATYALNLAARSLALKPGDEVLTSDHEYGAIDYTWQFVCDRTGARLVRHNIPLPVASPDDLVESFWTAVTPRTKVIAISHLTSPTALIFPVQEIIQRAREAGILTVIDGAHTPGQIPLDLMALDADFYAGNCHKWMCAPKGAGFLYVRREHHAKIEPLVISWGNIPGASFVTRNQWQGTRDIAAFLAVPDAIRFLQTHAWKTVQAQCHLLAAATRERIAATTELPQPAPEFWFAQMALIPLPDCDAEAVRTRLYDQYRIEVPCMVWNEKQFIRASFQGYNTQADADALVQAVTAIFGKLL